MRTKIKTSGTLSAWIVLSILCCFSVSNASTEFGKNKVAYKHFVWSSFNTPHFEVYYTQNQTLLSRISAQWIENAHAQLHDVFGFEPKQKIPLVIYNSPSSFVQTNIIGELLPEGVGGFTTQIRNRIVIPYDGNYDDLRHVLHHELVHGFEFAILYDQLGSSLVSGNAMQMPLWFAEGLAEYLSSGWNAEADMFLMDATIHGSIPTPGPELNGYMAYKGGQSFLYYMAASRGSKMFSLFLKRFKDTKNVENSFKSVYGKMPEEFGDEWKTELKRRYWPEIGNRLAPSKTGTAITSHQKDRSNFNLKPRISPDGNKIAFYSDIHDYTGILICDKTGKIIQEINHNGFAGSFEMFHPFRSGMCWSPTSDRLAIITFSGGQDEIRILDVKNKKLVRTIRPQVDGIYSPDWSPVNNSIVFCAIKNGQSDLFTVDIATGSCTQVTNDIYTKSDPRFTRDGKQILFSRQDTCGSAYFAVRSDTITVSQLWAYDLALKSLRQLTFSGGHKKAPCLSPDGKTVLYVSNKNGLDNMYIAPFGFPDSCQPISDVIGGCSSPDWAKDSSVLVYCLFQKGGWDIWRMTDPQKKVIPHPLALTKWQESLYDTGKVFFPMLPPETIAQDTVGSKKNFLEKKQSIFDDESASPTENGIVETDTVQKKKTQDTLETIQVTKDTLDTSIAAAKKINALKSISDKKTTIPLVLNFDTIPIKPYKLQFAPDMISLGVGTTTYYGYGVSGQWLAVFSDLMGNHQIAVMGDIQGNLAEYMHLFALYMNRENVLNYGGGLFYNREYASQSIFGDSIFFDNNAGAMFMLRYPFSMFSRLDLQGLYENLYRIPYVYQSANGFVKDTTLLATTLNIFTPSLSYVYDDILWGITGPLNGTRGQARLSFSPPIKHISSSFASFDVDFRKYFHLWDRFVWANKVAFGASIPLRDDLPARKFFLGGNENWFLFGYNDYNTKGYQDNINNFFYSDIVVPFRGWGYLDLIGTKFAVFNSEFRFPFIREFSIAWPLAFAIRYVNGAVFVDMGNAWETNQQMKNIPLPDKIYGGFGYGLRANLGIFLLRYDRAWKTDFATFAGPTKDYFSLGAEF